MKVCTSSAKEGVRRKEKGDTRIIIFYSWLSLHFFLPSLRNFLLILFKNMTVWFQNMFQTILNYFQNFSSDSYSNRFEFFSYPRIGIEVRDFFMNTFFPCRKLKKAIVVVYFSVAYILQYLLLIFANTRFMDIS